MLDIDFLIPALTLQPIVENAIQHGVMKRVEGETLEIQNTSGMGTIVTISIPKKGDSHEYYCGR